MAERELEKNKIGKVRSWNEMSSYIDENMPYGCKKMLEGYFRVQLRLAQRQRTRAKELSRMLDKIPGFIDFEAENNDLFSKVDIAVSGSTRRTGEK
jgi:hypothetical protein